MKLRLKDSFGVVPVGTKNIHHRGTENTEKDPSKNLSDLRDSVVNPSYRVIGQPDDLNPGTVPRRKRCGYMPCGIKEPGCKKSVIIFPCYFTAFQCVR